MDARRWPPLSDMPPAAFVSCLSRLARVALSSGHPAGGVVLSPLSFLFSTTSSDEEVEEDADKRGDLESLRRAVLRQLACDEQENESRNDVSCFTGQCSHGREAV